MADAKTNQPDHPIFGRADEDLDRAALLEGQLERFCEAILDEQDRLDDFLPPMTEGQSAEDWRGDLWSATREVRDATKRLQALVVKADRWRQAHEAATPVKQPPQLTQRVAVLEDVLERCLELAEPYVDVVDGDYGVPEPNKAMRLVSAIREVLPEAAQ